MKSDKLTWLELPIGFAVAWVICVGFFTTLRGQQFSDAAVFSAYVVAGGLVIVLVARGMRRLRASRERGQSSSG